jgi:outer membrane receptor for ferrienterochelin and colicins
LDKSPHEAHIAEQIQHSINGGSIKYDLFSKDHRQILNVYTAAQSIARLSYYGVEQDPDAYGNTDDFTFVGGSQYSLSLDRFLFMPSQFVSGVEFIGNWLDDNIHDRRIKQDANTIGAFFQNEWKNQHLSILLGGRLDKHNLMDNAVFVPRANVRYTPTNNLAFRIGYSSGYRAPQAFDEDLHIAAIAGEVALIELASDLKPEYSNSLNFSIDLYQNIGFIQTNLLIDAFYTDINNVFVLEEEERGNGQFDFVRTNAKGATIAGFNIDLKMGFSPNLNADFGFTIQNSRYKEAYQWSENVEGGRKMHRSPNNFGYAMLNYNPIRQLSLTATGNYTGSMYVPHFAGYIDDDTLKKTDSFFEAGIRFAYDFRITNELRLQVNGGVKNIFDSFQKDLDKGKNRDAGYIYGPSMPRLLHFGVKLMM